MNRYKFTSKTLLILGLLLAALMITIVSTSHRDIQSSVLNMKASETTRINTSELQVGDIIFWKLSNEENRAGHVAVVRTASDIPQNVRIVHSTDHPDYNAFVETHLKPTEKIQKQNRTYYVLRILDAKLKNNFLEILNEWVGLHIPFNTASESLMNKWDDSLVSYPAATKLQLQNRLFWAKSPAIDTISADGYMCSEIIIIALQKAFLMEHSDVAKLPASLQLDPVLCPPSTLMLALSKDQQNFAVLGELIVPNFTSDESGGLHAHNKVVIEKFREKFISGHADEKFDAEFISDNQKVKQELLRMGDLDQNVRAKVWEKVTEFCQNEGLDCTKDYAQVYALTDEVDKANLKTLKLFMQKYPWFKISDFGKDGAEAAWLIVQHSADADLEARILFVMGNMLDSGEVNRQQYALLYDRTTLSYRDFGIKQRYGSQFTMSDDHKTLIFVPCEGSAKQIDQRRKEFGMVSLKENAKTLAAMQHITNIVGLPE